MTILRIKFLPHIKFIVPTAKSRSVTLNGGMHMNAWYDITGLDDRSVYKIFNIKPILKISGVMRWNY